MKVRDENRQIGMGRDMSNSTLMLFVLCAPSTMLKPLAAHRSLASHLFIKIYLLISLNRI
jgi:hypothetical protein